MRFTGLIQSAPRLVGVLIAPFALMGAALPAWAQLPVPSPVPSDKDLRDVEEVGDIPQSQGPETKEKKGKSGGKSGEKKGSTATRRSGKSRSSPTSTRPLKEGAELALSPSEVRADFGSRLGLSVGRAAPWQVVSLSGSYFLNRDTLIGGFVGHGNYRDSGRIDDKHYDMTLKTRTLGLDGRLYWTHFERFYVRGLVGYGTWDGSVSPHGSDTGQEEWEDRLTSSYTARGAFVGVTTGFSWVWKNGFYLDWALFGMNKTWVMGTEYTRESDLVNEAVTDRISRPTLFGILNITVGYSFSG